MKYYSLAILIIVIGCAQTNTPQKDPCVLAIHNAMKANSPLPLASKCYEDALTDSKAYDSQYKLVKELVDSETIYGFKAAVTSETAQARIGATGPMMGVLFNSGAYNSGSSISTTSFVRPLVEVELGYKLNRTVSEAVSMDELKAAVSYVIPVIELPDIGYQDFAEIKPTDVIAGNAGSAGFIMGSEIELGDIDLNKLSMSLAKSDSTINTAASTDALGDQWEALHWLVNKIVEQGYIIEPDHILITGALGSIPPMEPGTYVANYKELAQQIEFSVK